MNARSEVRVAASADSGIERSAPLHVVAISEVTVSAKLHAASKIAETARRSRP
jgi:hypothetical protein